jgi:hypothetical protein
MRTKYADLSDDELLARVHEKFKGKVDFEAIEAKHRREINRLPARQAEAIGVGLLAWAASSATVYALGLTLAWIIRGFRQSSP